VTLHAGGRREFQIVSIFAADFEGGREADAQLAFPGIDQVRIVVLTGGFELCAFIAK
jgi:hypothetical protein